MPRRLCVAVAACDTSNLRISDSSFSIVLSALIQHFKPQVTWKEEITTSGTSIKGTAAGWVTAIYSHTNSTWEGTTGSTATEIYRSEIQRRKWKTHNKTFLQFQIVSGSISSGTSFGGRTAKFMATGGSGGISSIACNNASSIPSPPPPIP